MFSLTLLCCFIVTAYSWSSLSLNMFSSFSCHLSPRVSEVSVVVAHHCPEKSFMPLIHHRSIAGLSMLYKVQSNTIYSLYSEQPLLGLSKFNTYPCLSQFVYLCLRFQVVEQLNFQDISCLHRLECEMISLVLHLNPARWKNFRGAVASRSLFFCFQWRICLWGCSNFVNILFFHLVMCL